MTIIRNLFSKKVNTYSTIEDMPAHNWFKISETNDLSWMLVNRDDLKHTDQHTLQGLWNDLFYEYLETFGMSDKMKEILKERIQIFMLQCDMVMGDKSKETLLDIHQFQLQELLTVDTTDKGRLINKTNVYIEQFLCRPLDLKAISVKQYYTYVEVIKDRQQSTEKPSE